MIKKLKTILTSVMALALLATPLAVAGTAYAADPNIEKGLCQGAELQFGSGGNCKTNASENELNTLIENIVNIFSVIVGIVAVIMIIIGGFRYITSGGDSGNVTGAKNTILYAIVGLVIVALAQFIVKFVLSQSTSLT